MEAAGPGLGPIMLCEDPGDPSMAPGDGPGPGEGPGQGVPPNTGSGVDMPQTQPALQV